MEKMKSSFYTKMKISNYDRNFWVEYLVADSKIPKIFDDLTDTNILSEPPQSVHECGNWWLYNILNEQRMIKINVISTEGI